MKLIHNTGTDRVIDLIRQHLKRGSQLGCVTPVSYTHLTLPTSDLV